MIRTSFLVLAGLSLVLPAFCEPDGAYPAESFVVRHATTVMDMKADGTGEQTETMTVAVQSEAAVKQFSVVSMFYAKQSQRAEFVYVRVRHRDGTTADTPLSDVQDQAPPVTQQAPFYSDVAIKQLPVRGLRVGDTLEWQTHNVRTVAEAANQFWGAENFLHDAVIEDQTLELRVPAGTKLTVRTKPNSAQLTEKDANGKHVYLWSWKQLEPTMGHEAEALKKAKQAKPVTPAEEEDGIEGSLPDVAWTTFPSWEAVGAWYRTLEGDRTKPDDTVRAKVAEITAGKTTEEEKVRAIYSWVAGQIRYVGVALGVGRYQPHTASAVLENQYGDCKDKHTLLASMLLALKLQPDAVLIGAGVRFDRAVPSPASFNHLITRVAVDGKETWLDSTSEVADYRVLLAVVRDKDVLVVPQNSPATLAHTPPELPFAQESNFAVTGSLDGKLASDSTIAMTHHDDMEVLLRTALRQVAPSQYEELVQGVMGTYGFGGKVSEVEISHANEPSKPLTIRFHYHRDRSEEWGENRITAIFGPTLLPEVDKKDLPRAPIDLGAPRTASSTVEMKLPQGWSAELPEAVHEHIPSADCSVVYQLKNGTLFAERRIAVLRQRVPVAEIKKYADWYEACGAGGAGGVPFLQLQNMSATHAATGPVTPAQTQAKRLVNQANDKIRAGNYDEAETDLKQAKSLDENAADLWGDFGAVAMHRGDQIEAMRLYGKEIKLHPESEFAYRNLALLQSMTGDTTAATETLISLQKQAPDNPAPSVQAIQLLLNEKKNASAFLRAKALSALLSEDAQKDEGFRLVYGEAAMRAGEVETGEPIMVAIATDSTDLTRRNDASYALAMAGRDLPLAEKTEHAVLERLAEESRSWTGGEAQTLLRQKSSLMTAAWDTMGWILFKEGKLAEAESWLRPAMTMGGNAEVGEHLGDVLMAEKKPANAATAYAEALASLPATDGMGVRLKVESADSKALRMKLGAAKSGSRMTVTPDGHTGLQAMRTWKIGAANGLSGTAEFQVLLSSDGVVSASPIGMVPHVMQERVEGAKWSSLYPPGADVRLAAKVLLNCHANVCEMVREP